MRLVQRGQHFALVRRVLVEGIDVAADQVGHAEPRQFLFQVSLGLPHECHDRWVHIGDVQIIVRQHDIRAKRVQSEDPGRRRVAAFQSAKHLWVLHRCELERNVSDQPPGHPARTRTVLPTGK